LIIGAAFDSGKLGQRSIGWPFFPLGSDNRASHRPKACLISAGALFLGDAFENLDCDGRDKQMVLPSRRMVSALSQEPFAAVVAERLDVAHVGSQHFEAFVSAMIGDAEGLGARLGRAGDVAGPQAVAGILRRIEADRFAVAFDDVRHGAGRQRHRQYPLTFDHGAQYRAAADLGRRQPLLHRCNGPDQPAVQDGDELAPPLPDRSCCA
jgi:hypothetical protein